MFEIIELTDTEGIFTEEEQCSFLVKLFARMIAKNPLMNCAERISEYQERLVNEYGWDWEAVEALEIDAYKSELA